MKIKFTEDNFGTVSILQICYTELTAFMAFSSIFHMHSAIFIFNIVNVVIGCGLSVYYVKMLYHYIKQIMNNNTSIINRFNYLDGIRDIESLYIFFMYSTLIVLVKYLKLYHVISIILWIIDIGVAYVFIKKLRRKAYNCICNKLFGPDMYSTEIIPFSIFDPNLYCDIHDKCFHKMKYKNFIALYYNIDKENWLLHRDGFKYKTDDDMFLCYFSGIDMIKYFIFLMDFRNGFRTKTNNPSKIQKIRNDIRNRKIERIQHKSKEINNYSEFVSAIVKDLNSLHSNEG